jgi:hypothetical protein
MGNCQEKIPYSVYLNAYRHFKLYSTQKVITKYERLLMNYLNLSNLALLCRFYAYHWTLRRFLGNFLTSGGVHHRLNPFGGDAAGMVACKAETGLAT